MTVDEFERIADSLDDDHVEQLDGYIVEARGDRWCDGIRRDR
jgi:hypothetical protein